MKQGKNAKDMLSLPFIKDMQGMLTRGGFRYMFE
jgi:hypothetical protein